jgi:uncharacterized membrane protein YhaH (DUF805 family)
MGFLFGFGGRFNRTEWWSVVFLSVTTSAFCMVLLAYLHGLTPQGLVDRLEGGELSTLQLDRAAWMALPVLLAIGALAAATIKRLHDIGKSGWWALTILVPVIGLAWQIIECGFIAGDDGDNQFGRDGAPSSKLSQSSPQTLIPQGPPAHRLERAVMFSAAKQAHMAKAGRRSYQS